MVQNIFRDVKTADKPKLSDKTKAEVSLLLENRNIQILRVAGLGLASDAGTFCAQQDHEIVFMLKGELTLEYEGERGKVKLSEGDYIHSAPKQNNRVAASSKDAMWVKVSYHGDVEKGAFPSPDLKKLKDQMKRNVFRNTAMIESLSETKSVRLERVVSLGAESLTASGDCEQSVTEWLILLKGQTTLEVGGEKHQLRAGDFTTIAPKVKNRVASVSKDEETIWLAVYFEGEPGKAKYPYSTGY